MVDRFTRRERNVINFAVGLGRAFDGKQTIEAVAQSEPTINFAASQGLDLTGRQILDLVRKAGFRKVGIPSRPIRRPERVRRERLDIETDELAITDRDRARKCVQGEFELTGIIAGAEELIGPGDTEKALRNIEFYVDLAIENGVGTEEEFEGLLQRSKRLAEARLSPTPGLSAIFRVPEVREEIEVLKAERALRISECVLGESFGELMAAKVLRDGGI